jgi:formylglycine-generating enzyme required for sulfatase activity
MKWGKVAMVIFGAIIITALGIDASDTLNGSQGTLLSQVIRTETQGKCSSGMSEVENVAGVTCVDMYEASPSSACPERDPEQMLATLRNLETSSCNAESKKDETPWRYVTRDQAMQICARSGKRLPTNSEWYTLSLGMNDVENGCNVSSKNISKTGEKSSCVTPHGAYDFVGNVWEWVSDDVQNGMYKSNEVPDSGYVAQVNGEGMAVVVNENPQILFGKDYFWSKKEGSFGIIRGGYYDSGTDAGVYSVHADTLPTTASVGIGFRCVK